MREQTHGEDITAGGFQADTNISQMASHTDNQAMLASKSEANQPSEVEETALTFGGKITESRSKSTGRTPECDLLRRRFRTAQASAVFDPDAMGLLEQLATKNNWQFGELEQEVSTPMMWVKLAVLVRADFVEPLDNGIRVTQEGVSSLKNMDAFLRRLDAEDQGNPEGSD